MFVPRFVLLYVFNFHGCIHTTQKITLTVTQSLCFTQFLQAIFLVVQLCQARLSMALSLAKQQRALSAQLQTQPNL